MSRSFLPARYVGQVSHSDAIHLLFFLAYCVGMGLLICWASGAIAYRLGYERSWGLDIARSGGLVLLYKEAVKRPEVLQAEAARQRS